MKLGVNHRVFLKLDEYLATLCNTGVNTIDDIAKKIGLERRKVIKISMFFDRYNFITYQEKENRVIIDPKIKNFYTN